MRKINKLPTILSIIALSFASLACDISDIKDGRLIPFLTVDWKNRAFLVAFTEGVISPEDEIILKSYLYNDPPIEGQCNSFNYYGDTEIDQNGNKSFMETAKVAMCRLRK